MRSKHIFTECLKDWTGFVTTCGSQYSEVVEVLLDLKLSINRYRIQHEATRPGGHNLVVVQADEQSPVPVQHRPRVPATGQGLHSPRGHCEAIMEDCLLCMEIMHINTDAQSNK